MLLLLATLPIAWTAVFDTTSGAFILASAECDLQLTFFRKGVLVAFPYVGAREKKLNPKINRTKLERSAVSDLDHLAIVNGVVDRLKIIIITTI